MSGTIAKLTIDWTHPVRGRLRETVCAEHEKVTLAALCILGIGCSGAQADPTLSCVRCVQVTVVCEPSGPAR